ncbi:type II toxin-antitoxin system VapC family toxin [Candidatus Woesearchaeota archaeon]|nr:type II toxin-antitoxin system VapC family toxin [Candidatus Woesearchaeota archaeon]
MHYCLDTNVVVDLFRGDRAILAKLENLGGHYCITSIIACELYKGANLAARREESVKLVDDFIDNAELLDFNEEACRKFGEQYALLKRLGKPTQDADLMIGCIALVHNVTLVTRNGKDFAGVEGLNVISV